MAKKALIVLFFAGIVLNQQCLYAALVPAGQDVGARVQAEEKEKERKAVSEKIASEEEGVKVEGEEKIKPAAETPAPITETRVFIREIIFEGNSLISKPDLEKITATYAGKEMALSDFQAVSAAVTEEYRKRGYVTTFAYLPPQKVENETLRVMVSEGKVGKVQVSGNKWFGTDFLLRFLEMKKGDFFNYDSLRQNVRQMNERPDVRGQVVLSRGEDRGETDVDVQVTDHFPWHVTLGYNNYNSELLEKNKYSVELKHTNFMDTGAIVSGEVQLGEADRYQLYAARYLLPIKPNLNYGFYYLHVDQALGRRLGSLQITGEGDVANTYFSYKLINKENLVLSIDPAFEYKDFSNEAAGVPAGEENIRIAKLGLNLDVTDAWKGRNLITQEFDFGIADFLGGMDSRDQNATRVGAAGDFIRSVTNAARVQALPWSTVLMLKGAFQLTNYSLPGAEQFQIGGFYTVRGYPVSEFAGDSGTTLTAEWHVPPYFIPKDLKTPFSTTTWYNAITFLGFFDWGYVSNNSPRVGEIKDEVLYSTGLGLRFNLPDQASISFDYGFALGKKASDGADSRGYVEAKLFF